MIQGSRGWCTGMTQRDGMGREVGEGFRMGNTRTPVADSCFLFLKQRGLLAVVQCKVSSVEPGC